MMVAHWGGYSYGSKPLTMQERRRIRRRLRRQKRRKFVSYEILSPETVRQLRDAGPKDLLWLLCDSHEALRSKCDDSEIHAYFALYLITQVGDLDTAKAVAKKALESRRIRTGDGGTDG